MRAPRKERKLGATVAGTLKSKIVTISFLATFALNDARADTSSCRSQKESLTRGKLMLRRDLADVRVRRKALDEAAGA